MLAVTYTRINLASAQYSFHSMVCTIITERFKHATPIILISPCARTCSYVARLTTLNLGNINRYGVDPTSKKYNVSSLVKI